MAIAWFDKPRVTMVVNHKGYLEFSICYRNKRYNYGAPYTYWMDQLLTKSYFGFKDWNEIKQTARLLSTEEYEIPPEKTGS